MVAPAVAATGFVLAADGVVLAQLDAALAEIDANPAAYGNRGTVNAGYICGIIGTVLIGVFSTAEGAGGVDGLAPGGGLDMLADLFAFSLGKQHPGIGLAQL